MQGHETGLQGQTWIQLQLKLISVMVGVKIHFIQDGSNSGQRRKGGGSWEVKEVAKQGENVPPCDPQCKPLASGGTQYSTLQNCRCQKYNLGIQDT